jgi:hypothetical protein
LIELVCIKDTQALQNQSKQLGCHHPTQIPQLFVIHPKTFIQILHNTQQDFIEDMTKHEHQRDYRIPERRLCIPEPV